MGYSEEMATIIAMLQVQNVFIRPTTGQGSIKARVAHRLFEVEEGDLLTLLNVYTAYNKNKTYSWCQKYFINAKALKRAIQIRKQMLDLLKKLNLPISSCNGKKHFNNKENYYLFVDVCQSFNTFVMFF